MVSIPVFSLSLSFLSSLAWGHRPVFVKLKLTSRLVARKVRREDLGQSKKKKKRKKGEKASTGQVQCSHSMYVVH